MNNQEKKTLAQALYNWRAAYKALETDPEVLKARKSLERAKNRLEKAEFDHRGKMAECQATIEQIIPEVKKSVMAFGIRAKYTKGYIRASYDRSVLDRIAAENTRFRNLIMPHRKESEVKPRVNIEVAEPDTLLKDIKFSPSALEI